jgi:hypothetical protein
MESGLFSRVTEKGLEDVFFLPTKQGIFSSILEYKLMNGYIMCSTRKTKQPISLADPSSSAGVSSTLSHPMKGLRPPWHAL